MTRAGDVAGFKLWEDLACGCFVACCIDGANARALCFRLSLKPSFPIFSCDPQQSIPVCAATSDVREAHASSARLYTIRRSRVPSGGEQEYIVHRLHRLLVHHHHARCRPRLPAVFSRGAVFSVKQID